MRILLAVDGSPGAGHAVDLLAGIRPIDGAAVEVVHVIESNPAFLDDAEIDPNELEAFEAITEKLDAEASTCLAQANDRLVEAGWQATTTSKRGAPAEQILAAADEFGADLIVLGSTGLHGEPSGNLGRTARRVLKNSAGAVLIARERTERSGPLRLLFAFDDSAGSILAKNAVRRLAPACKRIVLLSVLTVATTLYRYDIVERMSATWRAHTARVEAKLEALADQLRSGTTEVEVRVLDGGTDAADEILDAVRLLLPDIAVVGRSGKGSLTKLVLGSVSEALAERAPCSVWIAPSP